MKILEMIQKVFPKRKHVKPEKTADLGGLTEKYFEKMGEEEKRLEAQGASALEIVIKLGGFGKHENDVF